MKTESPKAYAVLYSSTFAFMVCFVVWMMFGVLGIQIRQELGLSAFEFGLLTSTPVLTGALFRLPLGIWTDRFGGRVMMTILLAGASVPVYLVSYSQQLWHFLVIGLFLGLVGASFAIGTPYVARFFSGDRKGFAMGFFGAGTVGAAVNLFLTPILLESFGWRTVPKIYAVVLLITAVAFWFVSAADPGAGKTTGSLADQFRILRNPKVWRYCQYYSITFGGFTALSLWIPQYLQGEYGLTLVAAAALAAGFSLPGAIMRAVGGGLADRFGAHNVTWWCLWVAWVCLFLLSYPDTQLTIKTLEGSATFHLYMPIWLFVAILFVLGAVFAFGMASTFKYVADDFPDNMGTVTGIVGLAGGLAGFLLPIMFGILAELFQIRSSCFMLLYGVVWVSLIIIYVSEVKRVQISGDVIGPGGR